MASKPLVTLPPVVKTIVVPCSPDAAFRYFTEDFGKWWPGASHSVVAFATGHKHAPAFCAFDPKPGGRIYERATGGEEYEWGKVLVWQPPARLVFSWHPGDAQDRAQTVELGFESVLEGTRVTLTHTGWEKLGKDAEAAWTGYDNGWESVFVVAFASHASKASR